MRWLQCQGDKYIKHAVVKDGMDPHKENFKYYPRGNGKLHGSGKAGVTDKQAEVELKL